MIATKEAPPASMGEQKIDLSASSWGEYLRISDALVERRKPRVIYLEGRLSLLVTSREHDWLGERLSQVVVEVAEALGLIWEDAGQATFRREDVDAGVEGDKTFYFGDHAELMAGAANIDLSTQPPPDLVIEVEVSHPADLAVSIWGRLGVPEVWRYRAGDGAMTFWTHCEDGSYRSIPASLHLPGLMPADLAEQLRLADSLGAARWHVRFRAWVRDRFLPRVGGEG